MSEHNEKLELFIKSKNYEAINEFLIKASKTPHLQNILDIDYLIKNSQDSLLSQYVINLIYLLGEIGKNHSLNDKHRKFLIETYFKSDRWIRNEILIAFSKSIRIDEFFEKILNTLEFALADDYNPIKNNALLILQRTKTIPERLFPKIIKNLESKNQEIVQEVIKVLKLHLETINILYGILFNRDNVNLISKPILRNLLVSFFNDPELIEELNAKIKTSELNLAEREMINSELKTFKRILEQRTL